MPLRRSTLCVMPASCCHTANTSDEASLPTRTAILIARLGVCSDSAGLGGGFELRDNTAAVPIMIGGGGGSSELVGQWPALPCFSGIRTPRGRASPGIMPGSGSDPGVILRLGSCIPAVFWLVGIQLVVS